VVEKSFEGVKAQLLLFDVHKPQGAITQPEGYVSSLVELLYELKYEPFREEQEEKTIAAVYRTANQDTKNLRAFPLDPFEKNSKPEPEDLVAKLDDLFVLERDPTKKMKAAKGIANSIVGIEIDDTENRLAVPLSRGLAAIQNRPGIGWHHGAWNLGEAIAEFYEIGFLSQGKDKTEKEFCSPQERWKRSVERRTAEDPVLSAIDESYTSLYHGKLTERSVKGTAQRLDYREFGEINPFLWFVETWDNLNNEAWVDALPARQWTDWATAVLRLSLGLGYLWIVRWYSEIARNILLNEPANWIELIKKIDTNPLIPKISSTQNISDRHVWGQLEGQLLQYKKLHDAVENTLKDFADEETTVEEFFENISESTAVSEEFENAMNSNNSKQARDFVRYTLRTRQEKNINADHYGLLKARGGKGNKQYTILEPGTELIAVLASLTSPGPNSETSLKQVNNSLRQLGLKWDRKELIQMLQAAGLVKGSPDADEGVIVRTAY